ncbi:unnamed protein product, partial [Symbiodinium sp. CCMP2456]
SGKSTLAFELERRCRAAGIATTLVEQDWYRQRSWDNRTPDGFRTWEGKQFTDWAKLEEAVEEAVASAQRQADVIIVEGYLLLDCTRSLFERFDGFIWVESTKAQCRKRRWQVPRDWPDAVAYVDRCVWPVHEEYAARVSKLCLFDAEDTADLKHGRLQNLVQSPALWMAPEQDAEQRADRAFEWLRAFHPPKTEPAEGELC